MRSLRLAAVALIFMASFGSTRVSALTIDEDSAQSSAAARFGDPDNKIPFPHMADDGTPPSANFQAQPIGNNTNLSFGITGPSNNNQPSAFQRAQERMQQ